MNISIWRRLWRGTKDVFNEKANKEELLKVTKCGSVNTYERIFQEGSS